MTTSITKRSVKGSVLSWPELDANFENLRTALDGNISSTASAISALQAGQQTGLIGYTTKALMDADLNHPANTPAIVTNDATTTNNAFYIKIGASGAGSWQKSAMPPGLPFIDGRLYPDLNTAVAAQGTNLVMLVISAYLAVIANFEIPSTCHLWILPNGELDQSTHTLTIKSPVKNDGALNGTGQLILLNTYDGNGSISPTLSISGLTASDPGTFELIAHRGFNALGPENTLTTFAAALHSGAKSLEFDVQVSADGQLVVIHDPTVDRTTDGTGNVVDLSWAQLSALDAGSYFSPIFSSTRIPKSVDVLNFAKGKCHCYYEIKGYRTQNDIALMVQEIVDAGMENAVTIMSFSLSDLTYVRSINKKIEIGMLNGYENINSLIPLGNVVYLFDFNEIYSYPSRVAIVRSRGIDVAAWTVQSDVDLARLRDLGVTRIITDRLLGGEYGIGR